jgi:hypothetical protein
MKNGRADQRLDRQDLVITRLGYSFFLVITKRGSKCMKQFLFSRARLGLRLAKLVNQLSLGLACAHKSFFSAA